MKVAFHAPLKAPDHPVPSGDRTMARALVKALGRADWHVDQPTRFRSFLPRPDATLQAERLAAADAEAAHIAAHWTRHGAPDLWFTYHNYYKAPDLLGPRLTARFGLPYVVAEASFAPKRAVTWGAWCAAADAASRRADLHLCFTWRDRDGVARVAGPQTTLVDLPPFIDLDGLGPVPARPERPVPRLLAVAMMRPGDKLASHRFLAAALAHLVQRPWSLTLVGDGPARAEVERSFATLPPERVTWCGEQDRTAVLAAMAAADLFVWPGFGEAFGLGYLEAQGMGLPVVALHTAGVPSAVEDGRTGILVLDASPIAYADAIEAVLSRPGTLARMGAAAAAFVRSERSLDMAAARLASHLEQQVHRGVPANG